MVNDKKGKEYLELLLLNLSREKEFRKKYPNFIPNQLELFKSHFVMQSIVPDSIHVNADSSLVLPSRDVVDFIIYPLSDRDLFYSNYVNITQPHNGGVGGDFAFDLSGFDGGGHSGGGDGGGAGVGD